MLNFSDFSLIFLFISVLFYLFVSFKVAVSILIVTIATLYGAQVVFDFKFKPAKSTTEQSKIFSKKPKVKQKHSTESENSSKTLSEQFFNFLNFNERTKMNNSFSIVGRNPSFKTKSPKRNVVGRSHSFSVPSSSNVTQKQKMNQSFMSSTGPLLTLPFLPRVKRALGLDNEPCSRKTVTNSVPTYTTHPSVSSPGFLPAVRLGRREKFNLSANSSMLRSPNTVKIAPPEPHRLSAPRLLEVRNTSQNSEQRRTPDTQAVVSALKEKSKKRTITMNEDTYTEYPIHQAKRRRQESQQSNASTSSLPPLPDNLPDLSTSGYTIPRLETPTLKRTADLSEHEWEENIAAAKRLRKENRNNSIISSLSSMRRAELKEGEGLGRQGKRKVRREEKENLTEVKKQATTEKPSVDNNSSFALDRSDTVILPPDFDQSIGQQSSVNESNMSDTSSIQERSQVEPKLQKRVSLNETFSARKRQMSFYSGLNKSFKKVPQANVLASMEDYESDREAEQQRVQEMLEGIDEAEKEKQEKKDNAKEQITASTTVTVPPLSSNVNTTTKSVISVAPVVNSVNTSLPTSSSSASSIKISLKSIATTSLFPSSTASTTSLSSTAATTAQYTFKPAFGDVPSATVTTTTASASSVGGFSLNTGNPGTGITATVGISASTGSESSGLKFNFATVKSSATTRSSTTATSIGQSAFPSSGLTNTSQGILSGSNTSTTMSTSTLPSLGGFGTNVPSALNFGSTAVSAGVGTGFLQSTLGSNTTSSTSSTGAPQLNSANMFGVASAGSTTTTVSTAGPTLSSTSFGQNASTAIVSNSSVFGSNATTFGANTTTSGLSFGTNTATTNVTSGFSFSGNTNAGSTFGIATTSVSSGFGTSVFGQKPPPAYGSQNSGSSQPFSGSNPTGQTSIFAASQNAPGSAAFSFGGSNSAANTSAPSVFGSTVQTTATPSMFGSGGQITTASSMFGSTGQTTTAPSIFGSTVQTTSAQSIFGSTVQTTTSNSSSFNFGGSSGQAATNTQTNQTSMFGNQTSSQTSNFSFNTAPVTKASVFGNVQQPASFAGTSTFGQEKSAPFSSNPSTTQSGFTFGSSSGSFGGGQSSSQQTGFGAVNNTTSSSTPGSNTFTFGASTPVKSGFDFSSASGGSNSGFNFNANTSFGTSGGTNPAQGFGTPTGGSNQATPFGTPNAGSIPTPNFGTPTNTGNMFSIGSTSTSARPRATAKAKRRGGTSGRR